MLRRLDRIVNSDLMLVTGDAGSGKTHLLCDLTSARLAEQHPTVLLMGQQFTTREPPWIQARAQMDLGDISAEEFVGALEAAAQAANRRALFMIDAINEGEGIRDLAAASCQLRQRSEHLAVGCSRAVDPESAR